MKKQTGLNVDVSRLSQAPQIELPREKPQPFWSALEKYARAADAHIAVSDAGRTIALKPGLAKSSASVDGPFRITVRSVTARVDHESGAVTYDVTLDVHWEPRFPVFRLDSRPKIVKAEEDRGVKLTTEGSTAKSALNGQYAFSMTARLAGLTRESKSIKTLEGSFQVTASPKMLLFAFEDLAKTPVTTTMDTVGVTLSSILAVTGGTDVQLRLDYPENHPEFESFESWTDGNHLRLVSSDRTKTLSPDISSVVGQGRKLTANYRFKKAPADLAGWTLLYETPAPLTEYDVKFNLKDIALP